MTIITVYVMSAGKGEIAVVKTFAYAVPVHARHGMTTGTVGVES